MTQPQPDQRSGACKGCQRPLKYAGDRYCESCAAELLAELDLVTTEGSVHV